MVNVKGYGKRLAGSRCLDTGRGTDWCGVWMSFWGVAIMVIQLLKASENMRRMLRRWLGIEEFVYLL